VEGASGCIDAGSDDVPEEGCGLFTLLYILNLSRGCRSSAILKLISVGTSRPPLQPSEFGILLKVKACYNKDSTSEILIHPHIELLGGTYSSSLELTSLILVSKLLRQLSEGGILLGREVF